MQDWVSDWLVEEISSLFPVESVANNASPHGLEEY